MNIGDKTYHSLWYYLWFAIDCCIDGTDRVQHWMTLIGAYIINISYLWVYMLKNTNGLYTWSCFYQSPLDQHQQS